MSNWIECPGLQEFGNEKVPRAGGCISTLDYIKRLVDSRELVR